MISKKIFWIIIEILLIELLLRIGSFTYLTLKEHQNQLTQEDQDTYRILCLGESTTADGGNNSWPAQLEKILNQQKAEKKFKVINEGIGGASTALLLSKLDDNLKKYEPDIVITMMGGNDQRLLYEDKDTIQTKTITLLKNMRIYKLTLIIFNALKNQTKRMNTNTPTGPATYPQQNKKETEAEQALKKVLEINPNNEDAYLALGQLYNQEQRFEEAEQMCKKVLEINPNNEDAYLALGQLYNQEQRFEEAEQMCKKVLEINPNNDQAYAQLGRQYNRQGKPKETEQALKKALQINPNNDQVYITLGHLYGQEKMFEKAQQMFKKALQINPNNELASITLYEQYNNPLNMTTREIEELYQKKGFSVKLLPDTNQPLEITKHHYTLLYQTLNKKGIKLIAMQYPTRDVNELKKILEGKEGITFISNEENFKQALKNGKYEDYFIDQCYSNFGHATPKGNQLIAENVANTILKGLNTYNLKNE